MTTMKQKVYDYLVNNTAVETEENGIRYYIGLSESGDIVSPMNAENIFTAFRTYAEYNIDPESENMEPIYQKEQADDVEFMSIVEELTDKISQWEE